MIFVGVVAFFLTCPLHFFSQSLSAVEYGITMDENFYRSPYVMREEDDEDGTMFLFYNKKGGENASLDVVLYLRDSLGRIVTTLPQPIALDMSLVYHDGTPTPLMPKVPLKERRTSSSSNKPLFRPMRCATALGPGVGSVEFSFRIEEVSYHHRGKKVRQAILLLKRNKNVRW